MREGRVCRPLARHLACDSSCVGRVRVGVTDFTLLRILFFPPPFAGLQSFLIRGILDLPVNSNGSRQGTCCIRTLPYPTLP